MDSMGHSTLMPWSASRRHSREMRPAFVRLSGDPVAVEQARTGGKIDQTRKDAIKTSLKAKEDAIVPAIAARGGTVVAQLQSAINGLPCG